MKNECFIRGWRRDYIARTLSWFCSVPLGEQWRPILRLQLQNFAFLDLGLYRTLARIDRTTWRTIGWWFEKFWHFLIMFPAPNASYEPVPYDFHREENVVKWRGLLWAALQKVGRCNLQSKKSAWPMAAHNISIIFCFLDSVQIKTLAKTGQF